MNQNKKLAKQYCRRVRKQLPVGGKQKRMYLETMYQRVLEYLETAERTDEAALEAHFGDPENIALAFLGEMPYQEISRKFRFRNRVIAIVLAVAILALAGITVMLCQIKEYNQANHGYWAVSDAY